MNNLEKYFNEIPVTNKNNPFLNNNEFKKEQINDFTNHKVWINRKFDDGLVSEIITLNEENISEIGLDNIIGIIDLEKNYNEETFNLSMLTNKIVKITNKNNDYIYCIIQSYDENIINFAVKLDNFDILSYDLEYPINLIKRIEILK